MNIILQCVLLVVGFVMLIKGADWFVEGAAGIAKKIGIPEMIVGLTIVAMGTSAPEAAVSISAAMKGAADITVGNVIGSNIMNIFVILGLTALFTNVPMQKSTMKIDIPFLLAITCVLYCTGLDGVVTRSEGLCFAVIFICYLVYLIKEAKKNKPEETEKVEASILKLILLGVFGMGVVVLGSNVTVDAATKIAEALGMSERLIGLTIVALGTSLPELVTSVTAARKGSADIAIGNIVGSNIFNILFVLGLTAIITPVPYVAGFLIDCLFAIGAVVLLWIAAIKGLKLTKVSGVILLLGYGTYFAYLVM